MMRACYLILLAGLAGCTSQPQVADVKEPAPAPAAAAAPAPATASEPAPAGNQSAQTAVATEDSGKFRIPSGYKPRKKDGGETVYCKKETFLGTRFPTEVCMTLAQLREVEERNTLMRTDLDRAQRVCGGAAGCAAN
jgi:hypothetical protein